MKEATLANLHLITGPTRSGKSARSVEIARSWGDGVVFVATHPADPGDAEMVERVRRHRAERPDVWRTLEAPDDICSALAALDPPASGVIVDSIVLWLSVRLELSDEAILTLWERQLDGLVAASFPVIIVGDEIGWGPVPFDPVVRRFRDLLGLLGQKTAERAESAWLMVAGRHIALK